MCSTTRRLLAVLTLGFVGSLMAFAVGARVGAAVDGRVHGMTLAHAPMPTLRMQAAVAK